MSGVRGSPRSGPRPESSPPVIGVVDIGTNSVKLAVGYASNGRVTVIHFERETTRLGSGLHRSGRISPEAAARTARVVRRLAAAARAAGADEVVAIGTFALRRARNGAQVARAISRAAGTRVRILPGPEEARLALASVRARLDRPRRHLVVIDVGGGSTEFVAARGDAVRVARSAPIGALRLTERHLHDNPIAAGEHRAMTREIDRAVTRLLAGLARIAPATLELVVSGGSATTARDMLGRGRPRAPRDDARVSLSELRRLEGTCRRLTVAQRKRLRGLPPDRADIIPAGLAVVIAFARRLRKRSLVVSGGGVREGVILARSEAIARSRARTPARDKRKAAARKAR